MEGLRLLTLAIILLLTPTLKSEIIEVTTPVQRQAITYFNPNKERSTELEDTKLPNGVESFLPEGSNARAVDSKTERQGYVGQPMYPLYPVYNGAGSYFYPGVNPNAVAPATTEATNYFAAVLPAVQAALQAAFKVFTKLGLYLLGGGGLLVLGGIFTFFLCYLTPVCTLTFKGLDFQQVLNKDTMRSFMTPEKIAVAAAAVQDAIGKYQKLQRTDGQ